MKGTYIKNGTSVTQYSEDCLFNMAGVEETLNSYEPTIMVVELEGYKDRIVLLSLRFLGEISPKQEISFMGEDLYSDWGYPKLSIRADGRISHGTHEAYKIVAPYQCRSTVASREEVFRDFQKIMEWRREIEYSMYYI